MKLLLTLSLILSACTTPQTAPPEQTPVEKTPVQEACPNKVWCYTDNAKQAVQKYGADLLKVEPKDISDYCGNWGKVDRVSFYAEFAKAVSKRESNYQPAQEYKENFKNGAGETVVSTGLLQESYESCRSYGVSGATTESLKNPEVNLACFFSILNRWTVRDGYLARSLGRQSSTDAGNRGGARYFSTLRPGESKDYVKATMKEFCK